MHGGGVHRATVWRVGGGGGLGRSTPLVWRRSRCPPPWGAACRGGWVERLGRAPAGGAGRPCGAVGRGGAGFGERAGNCDGPAGRAGAPPRRAWRAPVGSGCIFFGLCLPRRAWPCGLAVGYDRTGGGLAAAHGWAGRRRHAPPSLPCRPVVTIHVDIVVWKLLDLLGWVGVGEAPARPPRPATNPPTGRRRRAAAAPPPHPSLPFTPAGGRPTP